MTVCCRQRHRQTFDPFIEEGLDLLGSQLVAYCLELVWLLTGKKPVIQRFKSNPHFVQLLFDPFVSI
jgi:hypothetical protein